MSQLDTLCVELTLRCPLRCIHCSANAAPERTETMNAALLAERVREIGHLKAVYLSGGEPFEHAGLAEISRAVRAHASEVSIYSSGVTISPGGSQPLSRRSIQQVADSISRVDISVYSLSPAEHDAVTGVIGSLERSLESIRRLRVVGVPFGIHFVPVANADALLSVAQYAREAGASRLHVLAIARQGRGARLSGEYSPRFISSLQLLARADLGFELVVSAKLRSLIGGGPTDRDQLRPAFLDVHGHLYAHEGARNHSRQSLRSLSETSVNDLLADMLV